MKIFRVMSFPRWVIVVMAISSSVLGYFEHGVNLARAGMGPKEDSGCKCVKSVPHIPRRMIFRYVQ